MKIESAVYDEDIKRWSAEQFESYNTQKGFSLPKSEFCFVIKNDEQRMIAFAKGFTQVNWLHLHELVVDETYRGEGLGSALLCYVEDHAKAHKCTGVTLNTLGFQAPDFYKQHGYQEFAQLAPFGNTKKHFFKKEFEGE